MKTVSIIQMLVIALIVVLIVIQATRPVYVSSISTEMTDANQPDPNELVQRLKEIDWQAGGQKSMAEQSLHMAKEKK